MKDSLKQWTQDLVQASNALERNTSDLKRRYFLKNIERFNQIASTIRGSRGSFGTGYPFYALSEELQGPIPVILEQIRYNDELIEYAENSKHNQWVCEECLSRSYKKMPNLKQVCKPCPNIDNELKPRKIINRLPDIDMWMVCEDGCLEEAKVQLAETLKRHHISPSDIRSVRSILEVEQIIETLGRGEMPEQFLPVAYQYEDNLTDKEILEIVEEIQPDGIEANYIYINRYNQKINDIQKWREVAKANNLMTTIGSDFHNSDGIRPEIGLINEEVILTESEIKEMINKLEN